MNQTSYQLKQAWAGLNAKRGFLVTVVTTLGLTLGALLCILTLAWVVISKPLPYPDQEKLFQVDTKLFSPEGDLFGATYTYPSLVHLYDNQTLFSQSALIHYDSGVLSSQPSQPTVRTTFVTPGYFTLLNSNVSVGRTFEESEAKDAFNPVAILSYNMWQNEFNGDAEIVGKTVSVSGNSFRVVGVMAESYIEPQLSATGVNTDIFLPWDYNNTPDNLRAEWGMVDQNRRFVGKLDSELSKTQIEQTLTTLVNGTWQEKVSGIEFFNGWAFEVEIRSFKDVILGDSKNTVLLLLAGVIGLVIVACANITNLFMSRTAEQQRQLAIQAALGAKKGQLFQTLFAQSGLVVFISVLVAIAIAGVGFSILQEYMAERLPRVDELAINSVTLGSAVLIALFLGLFFARLSANMINYKALNATLQASGKGTGIQVSQTIRRLLVVSQVTIVTLLIFVNMGLLRDSMKVVNMPLGFDTDNITSVTVTINGNEERTPEQTNALMTEVKNKLASLPQVETASQSLAPFNFFGQYSQTIEATEERVVVDTRPVDEQYFDMIAQPLIEGDYFSAEDVRDGTHLMIVNDVYAAKIAPQGSALGSKITFGRNSYTVSGVVKGVQMPAASEIPMRAYPNFTAGRAWFMLKLQPQQSVSRETIVAALQEVNGQLDLQELASLNEQKDQLLFTQYTTAVTSAVLAVLTFFLATIGLYGILNYATQMRRFEIGTRLAIGAKRKDVIAMIIKDNAGSVAIGIVVSLVIMLGLYLGFSEALTEYVNSQLIPLFVSTLVLISVMALFACYWPLRPIINARPIHSLRGSQ